MVYRIRLKVKKPKNKRTKNILKTKVAMAELFASSPYLTKKKKDVAIKKLFKEETRKNKMMRK